MLHRSFKILLGATIAGGTVVSLHAQMAQDPLLSRTAAVEPNIVFMFDDSGSMSATAIYQYGGRSGFLGKSGPNDDPQDCNPSPSSSCRWGITPPSPYGRSPDVNLIYYDPRVTFARRINADGTFQPAGSTSGISSFNVYFYKPAATTFYGVSAVSVANTGSGYPATGVTATFPAPPAGGVQATATVTTASTLTVSSVTVGGSGGSGYGSSVKVKFTAAPAGGVTATGNVIRSGGKITSISITNPGSGYSSPPTATLNSTGGGSGATLTVVTGTTNVISGISVTNPGSGYLTPPALTLAGGAPGTGANFGYSYASTVVGGINRTWDGAGTPTTTASYFTPGYTPDAGSPLASGATLIAYPNTADSSTANYPKFRNRTDCGATSCTWAQELQNYANWKTYHSNRRDLAKTGIGLAFQPLKPTFRLGWSTINNLNAASALDKGVRLFNPTTQSEFLTWLYGLPPVTKPTPNRAALDKVGQYFSRGDDSGPWADSPSGSSTAVTAAGDVLSHASCRRSYAMLMTDGYDQTTFAFADQDTTAKTVTSSPSTFSYTPIGPYSDTLSNTKIPNTFADVAMKYWGTDLRPGLDNFVKPTTGDEAYWQHLNFYAIGLGLLGTLDATNPQTLKDLTGDSGSSTTPARKLDWPTPIFTGDTTAIDDMWHATVNGRGKMLNARTADELNTSILQMMSDIGGKEGTLSGVAVSTASLTEGTKKYTPSYTSLSWNGNVTAYFLDAITGNQKGIAWQVETLLSTDLATGKKTYSSLIPPAASRNIYVGNDATSGTRAVAFTYPAMTAAGLTGSMTGTVTSNLIDYLRGDATNEDTSATSASPTAIYRARATRLGDIVNSTPVFVKDTLDLNYEKLPIGTAGQGTYRAYVDGTGATPAGGKKQRAEGVLFVGANDGMLHAFRDGTVNPTTGAVVNPGGVETFAYVPKALLPSLNQLADNAYVHRYFVDGPNVETDAYFTGGSPRWANLVLGTTGAGAGVPGSLGVSPRSAVYAIDATSLNTSTTSLNASSVLWEASSSNASFSELGHVLTDVQAGPTLDGSWVAIFGNGYESKSCQARLYIVSLETGALIKEINTGAGNCSTAKNGLGGARVVRNANQQIIGVYAGDLQGNLWKFNLNSSNSAMWGVDLGGNALFTAGATQPITAAPSVLTLSSTSDPKGGHMVVVGTGKFYEVGDITTTDQQSLYGIWDPVAFGAATIPSGTALTNKTLLVQQTIGSAVTDTSGNTFFAISTNAVDYVGKTSPTVVLPRRGWYIDFPNSGQRLVYPLDLLADRFAVADTISPATTGSLDLCSLPNGGTGYLYFLDALTGAGPTVQILDTNGDGNIDSSDLLVSGLKGKADGRNVSLLADKNASRTKYVNVSGGAPGGTTVSISCILTGTCLSPSSSKFKSREWRQLFMR